jgi:hypothetical protein
MTIGNGPNDDKCYFTNSLCVSDHRLTQFVIVIPPGSTHPGFPNPLDSNKACRSPAAGLVRFWRKPQGL